MSTGRRGGQVEKREEGRQLQGTRVRRLTCVEYCWQVTSGVDSQWPLGFAMWSHLMNSMEAVVVEWRE